MVFLPRKNLSAIASERSAVGELISIPFCTGGWDTKNPLPSMPAKNAVILDNMVVETENVRSREGFTEEATGVTGNVESLFEFANASSIEIISCAGGKIYKGLGTVTQIGTGFANNRWQGLMMNQNLLLFNGANTPQKYDGATLGNNTLTGSGLIPANLVGATNFKNRLIAWENNACGFWYGDSDAISGALDFFDLSYITRRGGYVVSCASWSFDSSGGSGMQARLVIFMSTGEAIVYEGTDPGTAESWSMVGRYKVAPPVSQRAIIELSGDILLVNKYDLVSFSSVFQTGETPDSQSNLVGAIKVAVANFSLNFGWQLINFPVGGLIILNVPTSNGNQFQQFVINTRSGGCSRFTGINARCFVIYNDLLYFGGTNKIYQALNGSDDDGEYINIDAQLAYSNLGTSREKTLNYIKPSMVIDTDINFSSSLNYDFATQNLTANQLITNAGNLWDTFFWDTVYWSGESEIKSVQYGVSGQGIYVSYRVKAQIKQSVAFYSLLYSYEIDKL